MTLREDYLKRLKKKREAAFDEEGNVKLPSKKRLARQAEVNKMFGIDTPANAALTALTLVPGLGALGLAAKVYKGMKAGKEVFKVGTKIYKSKAAAIEAAKKVVPKLKPKAKGNLSSAARGKERISRLATQKADTPKFRRAAGTDVKNQSKAQLAARIGAEKDAVKATGLGLTSLAASKLKSNIDSKKSKKTKNRQQILKNIGRSRPMSKAEPPQLKKPMSKAEPPQLVGPAKAVKTKKIIDKKVAPKSKVKKTTAIKGPARTVKDAKERGLPTFTNKAGKVLAAYTPADLKQKGFKNTKSGLRDFLNEKKGLTRKKPTTKKMGGGKVYRRGGGRALRGMGKAIYSNKMY